MAKTSLNSCTKIGDFLEYSKSLRVSYEKLHLKSRISNNDISMIVNTTSLVTKYYYMILSVCTSITLTDSEYLKYKYNPKLYCYDKYNSVELWSLLLLVNNMTSLTDFTAKKILVFTDSIFDILNEIMILEDDNINNNIALNNL